MAYDIGPRIGIDGESEFRKAIQNVNQQVRTLTSEMEVMVSSFTDGDDAEKKLAEQTRILNQQIEAQEKKVTLLNQGLDSSARKYGEADTKTLKWQETVNKATTQLNKFKSQLDDAENGVEDFSDAADDSSMSLADFGNSLLKGFAVGSVITGVKELGEAMFGLVTNTQEYRTIMGSLEVSSQAAGYSAEQTSETFKQLFGVLGDTQTAATTTANLQALNLEQEQLTELTNAAIGAWATYGDSIPIDSMAESINMAAQQSEVTGGLADVLDWAGVNQDEFKAKLQSANSTSERANIIMQELARQGLTEAGKAWRENNQDVVAMNEATAEFDEAMGRLGEVLAPVAAGLLSFAADVLGPVIEGLATAVGWVMDLINWLKQLGDQEPTYIRGQSASTITTRSVDGSYATGLYRVPYNGFTPELHEGEMIIPASLAERVRSAGRGGFETLAAGMVNGIQTAMAGSSGGSYTFNLVMPDNTVLARYQLPALIDVARANGTPILNPVKA